MKIALCAIILILGLLLAGCQRTPAEQQIRAAIAAAAQATETTTAGAFADVLSEDFDGNQGAFDRKQLANLLRMAHLRGEKVRVVLGPVTLEARGARYVARFTATLGGGGKLLPERLGVYRVETAWREEDGDWRCYSASWQ